MDIRNLLEKREGTHMKMPNRRDYIHCKNTYLDTIWNAFSKGQKQVYNSDLDFFRKSVYFHHKNDWKSLTEKEKDGLTSMYCDWRTSDHMARHPDSTFNDKEWEIVLCYEWKSHSERWVRSNQEREERIYIEDTVRIPTTSRMN